MQARFPINDSSWKGCRAGTITHNPNALEESVGRIDIRADFDFFQSSSHIIESYFFNVDMDGQRTIQKYGRRCSARYANTAQMAGGD